MPEAVANLQAALATRPNDQDLLYYLGRASGLLSKQSIDTLLAAYPDSARAHQALAENYFVLRQMPEAEKEYRQALQLRPDTPELHLELGEVYAGAFQWAKAEEEFRTQTKLQPGNAEAAYRLGTALWNKAKPMKREQNLCVPINCCQTCQRPCIRWERPRHWRENAATAEKEWTKLLSIEKESALAAQAHFGLANLYRKQGKTAAAQHEMQEFQRLQPAPSQSQAPGKQEPQH